MLGSSCGNEYQMILSEIMSTLLADKRMETVCANTGLEKKGKKAGNNNDNHNNTTRQAVKAEMLCAALGSVPVLFNTLSPCLAMLFCQAGKTFWVPVGEGGFLLVASHKIIITIMFENQNTMG